MSHMNDPGSESLAHHRKFLSSTFAEASEVLRTAVNGYLEDTLQCVLNTQPAVVTSMETSQLSALKSDFGVARDEAVLSAANIPNELDLSDAATLAMLDFVDEKAFVFQNQVLLALQRPVALLTAAGFDVGNINLGHHGMFLGTAELSCRLSMRAYVLALGTNPATPMEAKAAWDQA